MMLHLGEQPLDSRFHGSDGKASCQVYAIARIPIPGLFPSQTRYHCLRRRIVPPAAGVDAGQQVDIM